MSVELLNKISVAEIGLKKPLLTKMIVTEEKEINVCRVWGTTVGMETGVSTKPRENGDPNTFTKFIGDFMAVNLIDGKEFRSGVLFLPNVAESLVKGALQGQGDDFKAVQLAFTLSVKPSEKYTYVFGATPAIELKAEDPLMQLKNLFSATELEQKKIAPTDPVEHTAPATPATPATKGKK